MTVLLVWREVTSVVKREYECARSLDQPVLILEKQLRPDETRDEALKAFLTELKLAHTYKKFRHPTELRTTMVEGIQQIVADIAASNPVSLPNDDVRVQIQTALEKARDVCMLVRSPILIFGPRSYLSANVLPEEQEGLRITTKLVDEAVSGRKRFTLIASTPSVIAETRGYSQPSNLAKRVLKNLDTLMARQNESFRVRCTPSVGLPFQFLTYVVADEKVIIWIKSPRTNHCIRSTNSGLVFAFRHITEEYVQSDDGQLNTASLRRDLQQIAGTG